MERSNPPATRETRVERFLNRTFGSLVRLGIGRRHNYLVQVKGRKSGRLYATPVNLLEYNGRRYLVASRGEVNWARNARAAGEVSLRKGSYDGSFALRELPDEEKSDVLREFLERYALSVQRYYPVPKGSAVSSFEPIAHRYPVFELISKP